MGFPGERSNPRHRSDGKADWKWAPHGSGLYDTGNRFFVRGHGVLQHFGGNPVSCAIGMAVMDVIEKEDLMNRAHVLGERFKTGLNSLMQEHELIGDVRGRGLFLGVEIVKDRSTLEPAAMEASEIVCAMRDQGVLLSTDGPLHNVIKIKPPMVLDHDDVDRTLSELENCLSTM